MMELTWEKDKNVINKKNGHRVISHWELEAKLFRVMHAKDKSRLNT